MVIYPKKIVDSTKMRDLIEVLGLSIPLERPKEERSEKDKLKIKQCLHAMETGLICLSHFLGLPRKKQQ